MPDDPQVQPDAAAEAAPQVVQATPRTAYISFSAEIIPKTTESLLGVCGQLANQGIDEVHLLLSSPGGSVMSGFTAYNVLKAMPFKLITHNVGNVDSIGNVVFLAGEERYACPNVTFMFHGVGFNVPQQMRFQEKDLRERLGSLLADQTRIGAVLVERTDITQKEAGKLFLEAQTRDPDFALEKGIIHDIRDVQIPKGTTVHQLVFKR